MGVSDINSIVVITLASDGSCDVIEVEGLSWSFIWSLDNKSVGDVIDVSSTGHLSDNVEWSVDVHTPDFAHAFSWNWLGSVKIENIPLLMNLGVSILSHTLSVLVVELALNCKNLSFLVHDPTVVILEELIPSRVSGVSISISTSEVHRSLSILESLDSL